MVSVIVPCRNEARYIREFLSGLLRQHLGDLEMEILVADGMSDDGTRAVLEEFQNRFRNIRVFDNPERIASTGLNRAIRQAKGEIIIRMDAHTEYAPDYIRTCVDVLDETQADNVGGPALTRANGYVAEAIAHAFHSPFASGGSKFHDPQYEGPVDTVTYGCWRKSTLEKIGLFDERLVRCQDAELNLRLVASGGTVWQSPKIVSWYYPRKRLSDLCLQYFQYGFWKCAVIRKHRRPAAWRNLVPSACLLLAIALLTGASGAALGGSIGWRDSLLWVEFALATLYGAASAGFATLIARKHGWRFLPLLPIVFAIQHGSYAAGFLVGLTHPPDFANGLRSKTGILSALSR
jgi:succinoglycan biosynthesis protein ExoA